MTTAAKATTMKFGGREIRFLPLNWEQLETLQADLDAITNMKSAGRTATFFTPEERAAILRVITSSIKASNPDQDGDEWIRRNVNLSNVNIILANVFNAQEFEDAPEPATEGAPMQVADQGEQSAVASGS